MCLNPKIGVIPKLQYDVKYCKTGIRSQIHFIGYLSKFAGELQTCYTSGSLALDNSMTALCPENFGYSNIYYDLVFIPCRQCQECRFQHASIRAGQAYCEFKTNDKSCFLTLTYGDDKTESYLRKERKMSRYMATKYRKFLTWSLDDNEFQKFMKRVRDFQRQRDLRSFCMQHDFLRKCVIKKDNCVYQRVNLRVCNAAEKDFIKNNCKFTKIRFLHCGEYGSKRSRPHHHCILYGIDFNDLQSYTKRMYRSGKLVKNVFSKDLDSLWPFGDAIVGKTTYNSINYVARYVMKKVSGEIKDIWYDGRKPECVSSSTKPALGYDYLFKHFDDIKARRTVSIRSYKGKPLEVPICRYFRDWIKKLYPISSLVDANLSVITNVNKYDDLFRRDYMSHIAARKSKLSSITNRLVRDYESGCEIDDSFYRKLDLFGIPVEIFDQYKDVYGRLNSIMSYKDFKDRFSNSNLKERYKNFESYRRRMISYTIKQFVLGSIDRVRCYELIDTYSNLKNPYTSKTRGSRRISEFITNPRTLECLYNKHLEHLLTCA